MKSNNSILVIVMIMAITSFVCLTFALSYSYIARARVKNTAVTLETYDLSSNVTYASVSGLAIRPMSDADGLEQENYGLFSITKDIYSEIYSEFYYINVGYDINSMPPGAVADDLIPLEYVKIALYEVNNGVLGANPLVGPITIADLPVYNTESSSPYTALYTLGFGTFAANAADASYAIKTWADSATPSVFNNATLYLGIEIENLTKVTKTFYNVSGTVAGATSGTVSLQNGMINGTINGSGAFTLSNVPTGTWNLTVTNNGTNYDTVIVVSDEEDTVGVTTIGPNNASASTYLQASAYTYYSTPYKILNSSTNSLTNHSNDVASSSYTVPAAYKISGLDSLDVTNISNIAVTLNNDGTLSLSS